MTENSKMSQAFDNILLDILLNGREIVTKDGELMKIQATAADLNVVRQRLKDCGVSAEVTDSNPIGNIVEEMRLRGLRMPARDMDSDDAATG